MNQKKTDNILVTEEKKMKKSIQEIKMVKFTVTSICYIALALSLILGIVTVLLLIKKKPLWLQILTIFGALSFGEIHNIFKKDIVPKIKKLLVEYTNLYEKMIEKQKEEQSIF